MYLFLDISPDRLVGGSRFLFWAMRGWVNSLARDRCPAATLFPAFQRKGLSEVLPDFHKVMFVVHHREYRRIPFAERGMADITEFEAVMLSLWSDIAEGATDKAQATLKTFMDENWIEDSVEGMCRVVNCMAERGIAPNRDLEPAE